MYGFCSDGSRPAPSRGTAPATCANGRRDERREAREERRNPAQDRRDPRHELAVALPVLVHHERGDAGQDGSHSSSDPSWLAQSDVIV